MALTKCEKQARWRARHTTQRKTAARITNLLVRAKHHDSPKRYPSPLNAYPPFSNRDGFEIEAKIGWNTVVFDRYFYRLALLIAELLKTDKDIRRLRWALALVLKERKDDRYARKHWGFSTMRTR